MSMQVAPSNVNPGWQSHLNDPGEFTQPALPTPHGSAMHSSMSTQVEPSNMYPGGQTQEYEPGVFEQEPTPHGLERHSLMSAQMSPVPRVVEPTPT